jgi:predicted deacylase
MIRTDAAVKAMMMTALCFRLSSTYANGCADRFRDLVIDTNLPGNESINDRSYPYYLAQMRALAAQYPSQIELSEVGKTTGWVTKRTEYGFYFEVTEVPPTTFHSLSVLPRGEKKGEILIVSGAHATEPAGPAASMAFVDRLMKSDLPAAKRIRKHYRVTVVPMIDADHFGAPWETREYSYLTNNSYQRMKYEPHWETFKGFTKIMDPGNEARGVANLAKTLSKGKLARIAIDLHESQSHPSQVGGGAEGPVNGAFIIYPHQVDAKDPLTALERLEANGFSVDRRFTQPEFQRGQFMMYAQDLGYTAFTPETIGYTPTGEPRKPADRIQEHLIMLDELIGRFLANSRKVH